MMFTPESFRTTTPIPKGTQRRFPILNGRIIGSQAGFTLIEVIVSLILLGILVSMGGMAIVQVVQGYSTTRENATVTQQSQLAMSRITREIIEMINIPSDATATALPINNSNGNRTIGLDNGAVKMAFGADTLAGGDILIDNISAFTLTYYSLDPSSGAVVTASTWPATNDITTLTAIDINLQINRADGSVLTFVNRVAPRNNKNQGGAAPSVPPPSAPSYGTGCFIATAAYGDPGHPMVQILRDFRDRYLLSWRGGRWLVEQYYAHGPAAADLIRNRPLAMGAVRGLLAPIVALTFFLVYAPLAILFIIMISLIFTVMLFSAVRRGARSLRSGILRARGSVLIVLIVTMVIMAALGAAMITMFSASYSNQIYTDQGRKTYYLAESGFRYAASQFLNAGNEAARLTAMTAMNNKTCNLLDGAGSFMTRVYPYWFKSQAAAAGATTLATQVYGTIPGEFTGSFSAGQIQVGSSYYSYTSGSGSGTAITFSGLSPVLPTTAAGVDVQPVTQPGSDQSLSKSGSLTLSGTGSAVFPLLNGNFILNPTPTGMASGAVFNYTKRTGSTLVNVTLSDGTQNASWTGAVSIPATTKVVLDKFIRLSSTGTLGNTSREVNYNVPVGWIAGGGELGKAKFIDQFTNDANWFTAQAMGTHTVSGGAMQVTSVVDPTGVSGLGTFLQGLSGWGGNGFWGFNAFNWGNTNANLANAWMDASGCLSYDIQVKVKNSGPYFFAGLGFRMANNSDSTDLYQYGVSFVRARQTQGPSWGSPPSGAYAQNSDMAAALIPPGFYPASPETGSEYSCGFLGWQTCRDQYSNPAIILWQRTGPATGIGDFKLLAYRILTASDGVLTGSSPNFRLKDWSSLMVRLVEGYELPFTLGLVDASSRHLKYGDTISNLAGTKTARVIGTPVITTNWGAANSIVAAGRLILTTVVGSGFSVNEDIYLTGGTSSAYARAAGAQATTKASYIMVYYSDDKAAVAGNTIQADNTRIGNTRDGADFLAGNAWPPDDWTDRAAGLPTATPPGNDYFTLVQWNSSATATNTATATYQFNAFNNNGSYDNNSGYEVAKIVDGNDNTYGRDDNNNHYVTLTGNTCAGTNLGTITRVTIAYRGTSDKNSISKIYQRFVPYFGGSTAGGTYNQADSDFHAEGSPDWSQEFDITNGVNAPSTWSWSDVQNLDLRWITRRPNSGRLNTYAVRITVTYTNTSTTLTPTLDTTADSQGNVASFVSALSTTDLYQAVIKTSALDSKAWTSVSVATDFTGDAIALTTSGCTPSTSGCYDDGNGSYTYYDDFGIQLDTKSGSGFLPPIQQ
jgi:prepilin-type N-terminal cleavage/methylation domain-containing protein